DRIQRLMNHGKQLTPIPTLVTTIQQDNLSLNSFSKMMVNAGNQICERFQHDEVGNQSNVVSP
ncbi:MAG: hypothetical protein VXA48_19190, partial [Deltaproteobacteria bacterium]